MGPVTITFAAMAATLAQDKATDGAEAPPPPAVIIPPPAPPVSPPARPKGPNLAPTPVGTPGRYVNSWDYPAAALREKRSGATKVELAVSRWGTVADCRVKESSGHADLDGEACARLVTRARFWPATDAQGKDVAGTYSQTVRWELPKDRAPSVAPPPPIVTVPIPASTTLFPRPPRLKDWS